MEKTHEHDFGKSDGISDGNEHGCNQNGFFDRAERAIGVADATLAERLSRESERYAGFGSIRGLLDFSDLRRQLEDIHRGRFCSTKKFSTGAPLIGSLRQLTETAPVILIAALRSKRRLQGSWPKAMWTLSRARAISPD